MPSTKKNAHLDFLNRSRYNLFLQENQRMWKDIRWMILTTRWRCMDMSVVLKGMWRDQMVDGIVQRCVWCSEITIFLLVLLLVLLFAVGLPFNGLPMAKGAVSTRHLDVPSRRLFPPGDEWESLPLITSSISSRSWRKRFVSFGALGDVISYGRWLRFTCRSCSVRGREHRGLVVTGCLTMTAVKRVDKRQPYCVIKEVEMW